MQDGLAAASTSIAELTQDREAQRTSTGMGVGGSADAFHDELVKIEASVPVVASARAPGDHQELVLSMDEHHGIARLRPEGAIDSASAPAVEAALLKAVDDGATLVTLDLANVPSMSNVGLHALLNVTRAIEESSSEFSICGLSAETSAIIRVSGFDAVLPIASNEPMDDRETDPKTS